MFDKDMLMILLIIIYIICVVIEIKALKRNNIDIFYKENFLLVLINAIVFPLAIFSLNFGYNAVKSISWNNKDEVLFSGYFFTFIFASLAYIIHYIKSKIYAFITRKNKLSFLKLKTIYDKNNEH
ncbi:MAG: hypothetical protein HFJ36_03140 [Clostridia bacterium]|nr:hypothetical protein [Clostridia bacterium]